MRKVLYRVAASLDGYIAGPRGELDWMTRDDAAMGELAAVYESVDTVLLGRKTYELTRQPGAPPWPKGWNVYVFSRTLVDDDARVTVSANVVDTVSALRRASGKDIWLFGGGSLFRSLLQAKLVDALELAIMPVILGGGVPLVEAGADRTRLSLLSSRAFPSGIVAVRYEVVNKTN